MQRLHESNQGGGIKIPLRELEKEVSLWADRRCNANMNIALSRNSNNRLDVWKRPGLADMRNQYKQSLVSIKDQTMAFGSGSLYPGQKVSLPSRHCFVVLFQRPSLRCFPHPSKNSGTVQPHPRSNVFDQDALLDQPHGNHTHLLQRLVTDGITLLSKFVHTLSIACWESIVYLIMLPTIVLYR